MNIFFRKRRSGESIFKLLIGYIHLWFGLIVTIPVIFIAFTGMVYMFKSEVVALVDYDLATTNNSGSDASLLVVSENFFDKYGIEASQISIPESSNKNYVVTTGHKSGKVTYFDRKTGEFVGEGSQKIRSFFTTFFRLHRWLNLRESGGGDVVDISTVIFLIILISGLVMFFPLSAVKVKNPLSLKIKGGGAAINRKLHITYGFYFTAILLLIGVTGLYYGYPQVRSAISNSFDDDNGVAPTLVSENYNSLDTVLDITNNNLDYPSDIDIYIMDRDLQRVLVRKSNSENLIGAELPESIEFSGKVGYKVVTFDSMSSADKVKRLIYPIHSGSILGSVSKLIYLIVMLFLIYLPISGVIIWFKRVRRKIIK